MKDLDIDTYTATFEQLTAATKWEPNMKGTIAHYRGGLREQVHCCILNHDTIPVNMARWKEATRKEVNQIREIYNVGLGGGHMNQHPYDQAQYQTNQSRTQPPPHSNGYTPMDGDATNVTLPFQKLTDEEWEQDTKDGLCFR